MLRVSKKATLKAVKEVDAFPKIPEQYVKATASGGGMTLLLFILIAILVVSEVFYYQQTELKFTYDVDTHVEQPVKINIDITVSMLCKDIGADVLDLTGEHNDHSDSNQLKLDDIHFALSEKQRRYLDGIQYMNNFVRQEYHALQEVLWKTGISTNMVSMPRGPVDEPQGADNDACRIHGHVMVPKVAGNFHVTTGKVIPHFGGHAHFSPFVTKEQTNFSHRINLLSFGESGPGLVNPLDGEETIAQENYMMYLYFIKVVPTKIRTAIHSVDTFQYSVSVLNRSVEHSMGKHGVPGLYFKYEFSPLTVTGQEHHKPYWQFVVRMCGIVGGIFATSGLLHSLVGALVDLITCRFRKQNVDQTPVELLENTQQVTMDR